MLILILKSRGQSAPALISLGANFRKLIPRVEVKMFRNEMIKISTMMINLVKSIN